MSWKSIDNEDDLRRAVADELDAGPLPREAQAKLDGVYASLGSIPQDRPSSAGATAPQRREPPSRRTGACAAHGKAATGGRVVRRGALPFFAGGKNLPIYGSLEEGVSSLNAEVGETVEVEGVQVTLDSVSCDRNIVNLFFTLEKEGGFDLADQANYEGSQESEWTRLENLSPRFTYKLESDGESLGSDSVFRLDAYQEDGKVKVMQRIVPETTLPDQVDIALEGWATWKPYEEGDEPFTFDVGLDLSTVAQPRELGAQDLTFATTDGDKTMGIQRFTASELGTVMVVRNDEEETVEESGRPVYNVAEGSITPSMLKITDDRGNVLTPVGAGDGTGVDPAGAYVVELAGLSPDASSVTFTPMLYAADWESMTEDERAALYEQDDRTVDVSQIGAKLETSEYGGYELTGWDVADGTVSISLKPYGWQAPFAGGMRPTQQPTPLYEEWYDEKTGETYGGYHTSVVHEKRDYQTGELLLIHSYYAAGDDELRGLTEYEYRGSFGEYREEADAAQTLSF
ncbi:DUF4179 domain-containing protein [Eggerthella guodeyinii]|uniref:DUF4179 domain-containing protein n=1 Tax=Eggerthella guodeyinii TaxID=2690837 RepID=A0A6N7RR82_9ACTN|nr:DUF4179 domain-containing protein [Eggerthella guodeyinii]MRX83517.1 DUF4179 domain-containing protein [Eggerthella guodeyinii]